MRFEIITPYGSTFIYKHDHLSAAEHYAKLKGYKIKDRKTGKIIRDYCKSKKGCKK